MLMGATIMMREAARPPVATLAAERVNIADGRFTLP